MSRRFTRFAKGRKSVRGVANKTETRYAAVLESRRLVGEIEWYRYEGLRFKIAEGNAYYAPDFIVMLADGTLQAHECKAGVIDKTTGKLKMLAEEAARVRIKVAADQFPFEFLIAVERPKKAGGGFELTGVGE